MDFEKLKGSKTEQNLMTAFSGESQARNKYTYYASKAKKDGYEQIAAIFEETANNEKEHEKRYLTLLKNIEDETIFEKKEDKIWICRNCGHVYIGTKALEVCPVCKHSKSFMEVKADNYE